MNILIEGQPRAGKTTICRMLMDHTGVDARGFVTEEIRNEGKRVGFMVEFNNGESRVLSHIDYADGPIVGKYTVDLETMDWVVEKMEGWRSVSPQFLVVDEIGKMELKHDEFPERVEELLDSEQTFLGTIPTGGPQFVNKIREREDVIIVELTKDNREEVLERLVEMMGLHREL